MSRYGNDIREQDATQVRPCSETEDVFQKGTFISSIREVLRSRGRRIAVDDTAAFPVRFQPFLHRASPVHARLKINTFRSGSSDNNLLILSRPIETAACRAVQIDFFGYVSFFNVDKSPVTLRIGWRHGFRYIQCRRSLRVRSSRVRRRQSCRRWRFHRKWIRPITNTCCWGRGPSRRCWRKVRRCFVDGLRQCQQRFEVIESIFGGEEAIVLTEHVVQS
mmetsp:Transcript_33679/g.49915  ORF Transcript_33679/g.49915 Transcript_33679/m.49915 type:complete len:220 (+) Transcript_33679:91-750(+)